MLTVATFKWNDPDYRSLFLPERVNVHYAMFARNYRKPFRYVCITDDPHGLRPEIEAFPLWDDYADVPSPHGGRNPSCYRRLKLFHPETARAIGDRIAWLDLDMVILRDVTPIFDRPEPLVLLATSFAHTPYNGSMVLMDAGCRPDLWDEFSPEAGIEAKDADFRGSDQGYLSWKLRNETPACWRFIQDGIYSRRLVRDRFHEPPEDARIVLFMGKPDPWETAAQRRFPWLKYYYAEELIEETRRAVKNEMLAIHTETVRRYLHRQANLPTRSTRV